MLGYTPHMSSVSGCQHLLSPPPPPFQGILTPRFTNVHWAVGTPPAAGCMHVEQQPARVCQGQVRRCNLASVCFSPWVHRPTWHRTVTQVGRMAHTRCTGAGHVACGVWHVTTAGMLHSEWRECCIDLTRHGMPCMYVAGWGPPNSCSGWQLLPMRGVMQAAYLHPWVHGSQRMENLRPEAVETAGRGILTFLPQTILAKQSTSRSLTEETWSCRQAMQVQIWFGHTCAL